MIVWGSSFILIKRSLDYFSASEVGILRITVTFISLLPIAILRIRRIDRRHRNRLIISGLAGSLIPPFMFAIAQTGLSSSMAGILNSLTTLFTLGLGLAFFKIKASKFNVLGVFIGLLGATGLIYVSAGDQGFVFNIKYASLIIIATICYAFNVNYIKKYLKELDALTITAFSFFYIGIPCLAYVLIFSDIPHKVLYEKDSIIGLGYISLLAIVGTSIALIAFNKLIKMSTAVFASSVTYIIPVVAIAWGVIDGEIFKPVYVLWFIIIIIGVLMVNTRPENQFISTIKLMFSRMRKN